MHITTNSFQPDAAIPEQFAFAKPHPESHVTLSDNRNPHLAWSDVPEGCRSLALICVDDDVPTVPETVNQEDRTVPADQPRCDFYHWVMVDIPPTCTGVAEAECSNGVTPRGKQNPPGPAGSRQGANDFTGWFQGDPDMGGTYRGYDGPAPPWNDERIHHYHFRLYALDIDRCPVEGDFTGPDVISAIKGRVLAESQITGTYTQNPALFATQ